MGIGYILGCLASLFAWKLDRQELFRRFDRSVERVIKSKLLLYIFYFVFIIVACYVLRLLSIKEVNNFITAFLVIDISNTENKNLAQREKVKFYDSISMISRAIVCGFIAPLIFIALFGNIYAVAYMFVYNIGLAVFELEAFKFLFTALTIIPAIITEAVLYIVYLCRNRKHLIDFKGDYFTNLIIRPLLNVDILGAYIESVNFYYLYSTKKTDYLKSYGKYTKKIDELCVKDYLSIGYGICLLAFILFFIAIK